MSVALSPSDGPLAADAQLPSTSCCSFGSSGGGPSEGEMGDKGVRIFNSGSNVSSAPQCDTFGLITRRSRGSNPAPATDSANSGVAWENRRGSGAENTPVPDPSLVGRFSDTCRHDSGKEDSGSPVRRRGRPARPLAQRLAELTDRSGGPDACWPWLGRSDRDGYGRIDIGNTSRGAHVVAWETEHGEPLPDGLIVRHSCDNPPCCNPKHLLDGTYQDNSDDAVERCRTLRCEQHPHSAITDRQANNIKRAAAGGGRGIYTRLAAKYHVTSRQISYIVKGERRVPHGQTQGGGQS